MIQTFLECATASPCQQCTVGSQKRGRSQWTGAFANISTRQNGYKLIMNRFRLEMLKDCC